MKAFAVLALAAVAVAESDPLLYAANPYLGAYGYAGLGAYGYAGIGLPAVAGYAGFNAAGVPAIKASPCTNAAGQPVACRLGKREAESDPAILTVGGISQISGYTPYLGYGLGYSALGYSAPLAYSGLYSACRNAAGLPVPCAHAIGKREAEAEADPALLYSGLTTPYLGYGLGAYGYAGLGLPAVTGYAGFNAAGIPAVKAAPCTNYLGLPVPC